MKFKSIEILEKDCVVVDSLQTNGNVKPRDENNTLTKVSSIEPPKLAGVWRLFGIPGEALESSVNPRYLYLAASQAEIATALSFVLDKPRAVRGVLLFNPSVEDLPNELVCRLHAVRCPGIIVVPHTGANDKSAQIFRSILTGPFSRMPNINFRVEDSEQPKDILSWQFLVEKLPHRYSMKSHH